MDDGAVKVSGFSREGLAKIGPAMQGPIDQGLLSGVVTLLWRNGEVAQVTTNGLRDIAAGAPMRRDTIFRIASMTKPVTTVAALMLMEEGKLKLDDPITQWAPEFASMSVLKDPAGPLDQTYPAPRDITIEDLMTQRSGLAYDFTSVGPIAHAHPRAAEILNNESAVDDFMKALGDLPLSHPPGDRFHYGHSTDVLGFIVGRIEGKPFRDVLNERIFGPLGMTDTDFWVPPEKRDRATVVYRVNAGHPGQLDPAPFKPHAAPPAFCGGGGGLVSTADDYLKFARMLLGLGEVDGVRLLKPETVKLMTANRLTDAQRAIPFMGFPFWAAQGFGLGVSIVTDAEKQLIGAGSNGAYGWPGAFGTWWRADPKENMVMIYLIQNSMTLGPGSAAQVATGQRNAAQMTLPTFQTLTYDAIER